MTSIDTQEGQKSLMRKRSTPIALYAALFIMVSACAGTSNQVTTVTFSGLNGARPSCPVVFALPEPLDAGTQWTLRDPHTGGHYPVQILAVEEDSTRVLAILPDASTMGGAVRWEMMPYGEAFPQVQLNDDGEGKLRGNSGGCQGRRQRANPSKGTTTHMRSSHEPGV